MRLAGVEPSSPESVIDFISTVKELHGLSSQELNKLLRDSESLTLHFHAEKSIIKIDVEKLAAFLPLHLIAVVLSSERDESFFKYMLSGVRLLHSLCDLAHRHLKLDQVLLDDAKVSEQLLDLVFYLLIVLCSCGQDSHGSRSVLLVHSALVACSLHLLMVCISSQWQDLVQVLLAHPKVEIFMNAAFGAVLVDVNLLQFKLSALDAGFNGNTGPVGEQAVNYLCIQCEASLQFLLSLCQQKSFRERLLRNKELCGKGGVLFLVQAVLKLNTSNLFSDSLKVVAAVSRLKAKVLAILLHLCEAESISYLDEVASSPQSLDLAKSVALEVLELLKSAVSNHRASGASSDRRFPMGLLCLNAMRLADIFSDDSNFRSFITSCFTKVLTAMFSIPHGEFLSIWCSSELPPKEEDASVEYDIFAAAGWVLNTYSGLDIADAMNIEITLSPASMPQASYAHQRTSLFVKLIANLHCFVPNICEEQERNLFLHKFLECLRMDPSKSLPGFYFTSGALMENLRSLLSHAESLTPNFLNEEDVQLLRVFFNQLQGLINSSDSVENLNQEVQSTGRFSSTSTKESSDHYKGIGNHKVERQDVYDFQDDDPVKLVHGHMDQDDATMDIKDKCGGIVSGDFDGEIQNVDTSGPVSSSTGGMDSRGQIANCDMVKLVEDVRESGLHCVPRHEKSEAVQFEEKHPRKRKRTIMNDYQMMLVEKALVDEPDMQRHAASLQSWARKLSVHGPEVTSLQLKNWVILAFAYSLETLMLVVAAKLLNLKELEAYFVVLFSKIRALIKLNNRKARLARAGKDVHVVAEVDKAFVEKEAGSVMRCSEDPPESLGEDNIPSGSRGFESESKIGTSETSEASLASDISKCIPGQSVMLVDGQGEEVGKGKLHQVQGKWYGKSLEESETCVVDITELKVESYSSLPYPSEATGTSFSEAKIKIGAMRVLWNPSRLLILRHQNSAEKDKNN